MQMALYSVQKAYSKDGDKDAADLLMHILLQRVEIEERNLQKIVLDESLKVVPKLTNAQIDILSLVFLVRIHRLNKIASIEDLRQYLEEYFEPLCKNLTDEPSSYLHIQYANCGSVSNESYSIEDAFLAKYPNLFKLEFEWQELKDSFSKVWPSLVDDKLVDWNYRLPKIVRPCHFEPKKLQTVAYNEVELRSLMDSYSFNNDEKNIGNFIFRNYGMSKSVLGKCKKLVVKSTL